MSEAPAHDVFVTGATGYMGRALIPVLLARAHSVRALARPGSEQKLPAGVVPVAGDALDATSFQDRIAPADTLIHLVGSLIPHPGKGSSFVLWISYRYALQSRGPHTRARPISST